METAEKHLHVVSFDVPFPANYGGIIDVFYRIKTLSESGVKIHLHCFEYSRNRIRPKELDDICFSVDYYQRKEKMLKMLSKLPYIVSSRKSGTLVENLLKDDYPILIEGLHCCMLLTDSRLADRRKYVRMHNVEHDYYKSLAKVEKKWLKRLYLKMEVPRLEKYEKVLGNATGILAITDKDKEYFESKGYPNVLCMPSAVKYDMVKPQNGRGTYALFHGQLSVAENYNAVIYLAKNVFSKMSIKLKVAGLNPPRFLEKMLQKYPNIELIKNPSELEMNNLVKNAQVNVLVTNPATGLKLKLLNSLYNGRYCLVNSTMVEGTNLEPLCIVADTPDDMKAKLKTIFDKDFDNEDLSFRIQCLDKHHNNALICSNLINEIFAQK